MRSATPQPIEKPRNLRRSLELSSTSLFEYSERLNRSNWGETVFEGDKKEARAGVGEESEEAAQI